MNDFLRCRARVLDVDLRAFVADVRPKVNRRRRGADLAAAFGALLPGGSTPAGGVLRGRQLGLLRGREDGDLGGCEAREGAHIELGDSRVAVRSRDDADLFEGQRHDLRGRDGGDLTRSGRIVASQRPEGRVGEELDVGAKRDDLSRKDPVRGWFRSDRNSAKPKALADGYRMESAPKNRRLAVKGPLAGIASCA